MDERDWADTRYFEVPPGSHELTVRYQFPVAPSNIGPVDAPLWRDCQVKLTFKDFNAGQRYQLQAGSIGFRPGSNSTTTSRNWSGKVCQQVANAPDLHKRRYACNSFIARGSFAMRQPMMLIALSALGACASPCRP